ncbi:MAG: metallophosphoesterase family protein [Desulfopila sp.]
MNYQNRPDTPLGNKVFSFAVIADSHLNQQEAGCNSPFAVNKLANGRMRYVIRDINSRDIDFVIHLGDLVHPVPAVKDLYLAASQRFFNQVKELKMPLYLVPGNHDIGDKPMPWAPVGVVTDEYIALWQETFGDHYYSFDHRDIHFIVINSQLMNSGLAAEAEQARWLENDLRANRGKRMFLCTHYPPFLCETVEPEHYDNIAEPARSWLLEAMADKGVEGLFAGHVHNFWYLRHAGTHHYLLPSTAFVRQDYSEMFKAPPALEESEAGRNDAPKLGYFIVNVHRHGHVCRMVRTYGEILGPSAPQNPRQRAVVTVSPLENRFGNLGFDLRQSWADKMSIPPSGALDEFDRKEVRNDYPLLALWEMGITDLRIPMQDLRQPQTRSRLRDLQQLGQRFTLFSFHLPGRDDRRLVAENSDILAGWEIGFRWEDLAEMAPALAALAQETGIPLYLSRMWGHEENLSPGGQYYHVMNHGFTSRDGSRIDEMMAWRELHEIGLVFRIMHDDDVSKHIDFAASRAQKYALPVHLHLRMAGYNPAVPTCDDTWFSSRIAEALMHVAGRDDVVAFVDTLIDIDRGYFVRNGALDQICNPRQGARIIGNLHGTLNAYASLQPKTAKTVSEDGSWIVDNNNGLVLFIAGRDMQQATIAKSIRDRGVQPGQIINLADGTIVPMTGALFTCQKDDILLFTPARQP